MEKHRTKTTDEPQRSYEDIDISAIHINQDITETTKAQPNEYSAWNDREYNKPSAKSEHVSSHKFTLQDPKFTERRHVNTKWKIATITTVILCAVLTSGLITALVVRPSARVSPCSESRCSNGGTCVVVSDDHAVCTCVNGFYGTQCEMTPCSNSSCKNEGTCYIHQLQSRCACSNGFMGTNCQMSLCSSKPCMNGGTCSIITDQGIPQIHCSCPVGFHGLRCDVSLCSSEPCINGGTCSMTIAHDLPQLQCACPTGFSGLRCEVTSCSSYPCLNGGICSTSGSEYNCTCPESYSGPRCEVTPCSNSSCKNEGTCYIHQLQSRCACRNGFVGTNCELSLCSGDNCMNGGTCSVIISEGIPRLHCACPVGYHGLRCDASQCSSEPCLNGGICSINITQGRPQFRCACPPGFSGLRCEGTPCSPNPCLNGGVCSIIGSGHRCTCPTSRSGARCEVEVWLPVFVAFSGNGQSVYDSWQSQLLCNELSVWHITMSKSRHLRHKVVDNWSGTIIHMVKVEILQSNQRVAWMTFNARYTNSINWFSKENLHDSSFNDLTRSSSVNYFSMYGDVRSNLDRKFFVNRQYDGCEGDFGWFVVADKHLHCPWEKRGSSPVFMYTDNYSPRNWHRDTRTADTMVIAILADL